MVGVDELRAVAENARLDLAEDELESLRDDVESILDAFSSLDEIDTDGVAPAFHPIDLDDGTRPDEREACLTQDEALSNTDNTDDGFFKGPRAT